MKAMIKTTGVMIAVTLIILGLSGCQSLGAASAASAANSPVGNWTGTITPEGSTSVQNGVIFSSDGTMTVMEDTGVLGLGVWEKVSGNQYAFTFWETFLQDGANLQAKVRSTIELSDDKETYSGPFHFQIMDMDGNVLVEGTGQATAVRNHVEPMP
jgi:hypothetical protein